MAPGAKQLSKIPNSRENSPLYKRSRLSVLEVERHAERGSESFRPFLSFPNGGDIAEFSRTVGKSSLTS
jgi:hypothetical protein